MCVNNIMVEPKRITSWVEIYMFVEALMFIDKYIQVGAKRPACKHNFLSCSELTKIPEFWKQYETVLYLFPHYGLPSML